MFEDREHQLGRDDLIFPLYFIDVPGLHDPARRMPSVWTAFLRNSARPPAPLDRQLAMIAARQYADFRALRNDTGPGPAIEVERLARSIAAALRRRCTSETIMHRMQAEIEERTRKEDEQRQQQEEQRRARAEADDRERKEAEERRRQEEERRAQAENQERERREAKQHRLQEQSRRPHAEAQAGEPYRVLSDSPELVGFFSYSRGDDADSMAGLSALRDRIQRELRSQLGRSQRDLRLWQDKAAIPRGTYWERQIEAAVAQSVFFIAIVTPRSVRSDRCLFEYSAFLQRERELGRDDLFFPVLYIQVDALHDETMWRTDPLLSLIVARQWDDFRQYRHRDVVEDVPIGVAVEKLCGDIVKALNRSRP